jgi:hypothetical protein
MVLVNVISSESVVTEEADCKMVCPDCRTGEHKACRAYIVPGKRNQEKWRGRKTLCDCQHDTAQMVNWLGIEMEKREREQASGTNAESGSSA